MPFELPEGDKIGWIIGIIGAVIAIAAIVDGQRARHEAERKPQRDFEKFLASDVPQQAAAIIADSLYTHLPKAIGKSFANAWVRRIANDIPANSPDDHQRLVRFTRLFVEHVFYDTAATKQDEAAMWPGQDAQQHLDSLKTTYLAAQTCFTNFSPREYETPFPLQEMVEGIPSLPNYFTALKTQSLPDALMVPRERFLSQIRINTGFVAPLHLVRGLLQKMDDDWPLMLAQFRKSISIFPLTDEAAKDKPELVLEHIQAFEFYCWLLWGPSIQMCGCDGWEGLPQILQYGYGDENNSFHLVFDNEQLQKQSWNEIKNALVHAKPPLPLAIQTAITATPMWGPNCGFEVPWVYNPVDGTRHAHDMGLMLRCDKPISADSLLVKNMPYYSAYIWIMFEICDPKGRLPFDTGGSNAWRRLLPLWEHGNIADGTTFSLLKDALVRKSLALLQDLEQRFSGPDGEPAVYFTYVCAIDDAGEGHSLQFEPPDMATTSLRSRLEHLAPEAMRKRLFPKPRRSQESMALLDSSCHLTHLVDAWYQSLPQVPV